MCKIKLVIDEKLLEAFDLAARRAGRNRSALMQDVLREHIERLELRSREEQDRQGYARRPQVQEEGYLRESGALWPQ